MMFERMGADLANRKIRETTIALLLLSVYCINNERFYVVKAETRIGYG